MFDIDKAVAHALDLFFQRGNVIMDTIRFRRGRIIGSAVAAAALAGLVATCDEGGELVDPPVPAPVPASIKVTPPTVSLEALDDTVVLVAQVLDQHGAVMSGAVVSWSSGDDAVATVSDAGLVTAAGNGATAVTASAGGVEGQAQVSVGQRIASVVVTPDSLFFSALGDTARLTAEARYANGAPVADAVVSWATGNESVATVNDTGLVTAAGSGPYHSTLITASADGITGQAEVRVYQTIDSLFVTPDSLSFAIGDTASFAVHALDPNGEKVFLPNFVVSRNHTPLYAFRSSTNPDSVYIFMFDEGGGGDWYVPVNSSYHDGRTKADGPSDSVFVTVAFPDSAALAAFDNSTTGWHSNWFSADPIYLWDGVEVAWEIIKGLSTDHGRVMALDLVNRSISGQLTGELENLPYLTRLELPNNLLSGSIPAELGNLSNFDTLDLSNNDINGPIPAELGNWTFSTYENRVLVDLSDNDLSGSIPAGLGNLTFPKWAVIDLDLSNNDLSGPIPVEMGNISARRLDLSNNDLSGSIPAELGNHNDTRLELLDLSDNDLSGPIPPGLGNLWASELVDLSDNDLSGSIPTELGNIDVPVLDLSNNDLIGSIPAELLGSHDLMWLDLSGNELSDSIPRGIEYPDLSVLDLSNNDLIGSIPAELLGSHDLMRLDLSNNKLTGTIRTTTQEGWLTVLSYLDLRGNELAGPLHDSILNLYSLDWLRVDDTVCAPQTPNWEWWLKNRVSDHNVAYCK